MPLIYSDHPEQVEPVRMDLVERRLQAGLDLLRRTYRPVDDQHGGWYHDLSDAPPGPVATALALLAFRVAGQRFAAGERCWAVLRRRQVVSRDPLRGGDWASNTAAGQPTVEATGVVVRLLGEGNYGLADFAPKAASAVALGTYLGGGGSSGDPRPAPGTHPG